MTPPCPTCGFDRRYKHHRDKVVSDAVAKETKKLNKRIKELERPPARRTQLVSLPKITERIESQRSIGWSMGKLSFDDIESLIEEIEDLRRCRHDRRENQGAFPCPRGSQ